MTINSLQNARVIDCHAHVRIEVDMGPQWQHGPEYGVDDKGQPVPTQIGAVP